jgi:hypothetical protein
MASNRRFNEINSRDSEIASNLINISVDMGKNELEAISFNQRGEILGSVNFDSVIKKHLKKPVNIGSSNPNRFTVGYKGKYYEIGDEIETGTHSNDNTKLNEHHKLCLLLSIGLLVGNSDHSYINLVVGLPSSHISNPLEKDNFKKMLKDEEGKETFIEINGKIKRFTISKITEDSEGLAMIPRMKLFMNEGNKLDIAVIDIGGHNFNLRKFNCAGHVYGGERGISEEAVGVNNLLTKLNEELLSGLEDRNRNITKSDLKRYVKNRNLDDDMKINWYSGTNSEFVEEFVKNYIEENILNKLSAHGVKPNAKGMIYLFTGGGANLLRGYLEEMFENNKECIKFSNTAKWDNCLSFALNYLFNNTNANKGMAFKTLCEEFDNKLSNEDKNVNFSMMNSMKMAMKV